jgi:hypothetical protein
MSEDFRKNTANHLCFLLSVQSILKPNSQVDIKLLLTLIVKSINCNGIQKLLKKILLFRSLSNSFNKYISS